MPDPEPDAAEQEPSAEPVRTQTTVAPRHDRERYPDELLAPVDAPPPRRTRRRPVRVIDAIPRWSMLTIAILGALLAVTVGALVRTQVEPDADTGTIVATAPIGPDGGTLPFGPGASLEVPPQAVDTTTVFTVRRFADEPRAGGNAVLGIAGASYAFEPAHVDFALAVTITFPLPDGPVPDVVVDRGGRTERLRAFIDPTEETISIRTRDFSRLTLAEP